MACAWPKCPCMLEDVPRIYQMIALPDEHLPADDMVYVAFMMCMCIAENAPDERARLYARVALTLPVYDAEWRYEHMCQVTRRIYARRRQRRRRWQ
jgi:hypothetical protein